MTPTGLLALMVVCSFPLLSSGSDEEPTPPLPPPPRLDCSSSVPLQISAELPSVSGGNGNIHSSSLSPWTWSHTSVRDRIPNTIWEARCGGLHCSDPALDPGPGSAPAPDRSLNAVPVLRNLLVLTRERGARCYRASLRPVAVGCTCVRATARSD